MEVNIQMAQENDVLTFDEILTEKVYKAEFDRRVAKAVETARTKLQVEHDQAVESSTTESNTLKAQVEALNKELTSEKASGKLTGKEFSCKPEFLKFVNNEINSMVTDKLDFDSAAKQFKEEYPQYFNQPVVVKKSTSPDLSSGKVDTKGENDEINDFLRGEKGE